MSDSEDAKSAKSEMDAIMERIQARFTPEVVERMEREAAERKAREEAENSLREKHRREARLVDRRIPRKDIELILADSFRQTPALDRVRAFHESDESRLLVLSGVRGCGKTSAASWLIAQECPDEYFDASDWRAQRTWPPERRPLFLRAAELQRIGLYDEAKIGPFETCSMLALDDLGSGFEDVKGAFASQLDSLIDARYAAQLRTVITTNMVAKDFKRQYGERIVDRIRETGCFVELVGESLRGR